MQMNSLFRVLLHPTIRSCFTYRRILAPLLLLIPMLGCESDCPPNCTTPPDASGIYALFDSANYQDFTVDNSSLEGTWIVVGDIEATYDIPNTDPVETYTGRYYSRQVFKVSNVTGGANPTADIQICLGEPETVALTNAITFNGGFVLNNLPVTALGDKTLTATNIPIDFYNGLMGTASGPMDVVKVSDNFSDMGSLTFNSALTLPYSVEIPQGQNYGVDCFSEQYHTFPIKMSAPFEQQTLKGVHSFIAAYDDNGIGVDNGAYNLITYDMEDDISAALSQYNTVAIIHIRDITNTIHLAMGYLGTGINEVSVLWPTQTAELTTLDQSSSTGIVEHDMDIHLELDLMQM